MRVLSLICFALSIWIPVADLAAQESASPLRLAIFGPADEVARLEAGLSGQENLEILTRNDLRMILGEQVLESLAGNPPAFGNLLGADLFLLIESDDPPVLRLIDAATGEELDRGIAVSGARALTAAAAAMLTKARIREPSASQTVAVLDIDGPEIRTSGEVLREWLAGAGFRVLDRTLTLQVLDERSAKEAGFRVSQSSMPPFPGASHILQLTPMDTPAEGHQITLLADDGTVRGRHHWHSAPQPDAALETFLQEQLGGSEHESVAEFRQRVNIEALLPFYEGVNLYESGQPLEATIKFQQAYEMNHLFLAAYLWEIRCYEAAGLPEFASAMERWMATGFSGRGVGVGGDVTARDGITFLGVTENQTDASPEAVRLTLSAIDVLSGPDLFLPSSLAAIRDEYDLMAGASHGEGARWSRSEGFISRHILCGRLLDGGCEWVLSDNLSGEIVAQASQVLGGTPDEWDAQLQQILPSLLAQSNAEKSSPATADIHLPSYEDAKNRFDSATSPAERNVALLQMLLIDPTTPEVIGGKVNLDLHQSNQLDIYLAHAKRATLLRLLPVEHSLRPWLELDEIQTFMPFLDTGPELSGEERDSQTELKRFSEAYHGLPAGILARFFWLTDSQATMPPEQLAAEAAALAPRLREANEIPKNDQLAKMCEAMEWLGRAAAGEPGMILDPKQTTPRAQRLEITDKAEIRLLHNDSWRVQDFRILPLTPAEIQNEARAAIAIGGRADRKKRVEPAWMEDYPGSFSIASFVGWLGIYEFSHVDGLPHPFPGDYEKLRGHWQTMIRYTEENLIKWLDRVQNEDQFGVIDAPLQRFFPGLAGYGFTVSEEEYAAIHARVMAAAENAAKRIGIPNSARRSMGHYQRDWRDLTLAEARKQGADALRGSDSFMRDIPPFAKALQEFASKAFVDEFPSYRDWWQQSNWSLDSAMSNREFATRFVLPYHHDIQRTYGNGVLSDDERAMVLDAGIVLLWGWHYAEAEEIFKLVVEAPSAVGSNPRTASALKALALLQQARLHVQARNRPAAITTLHQCLKESEGLEVSNMWRVGQDFRNTLLVAPGQRNNLRSIAVRMLEELRFDPDSAVLPERVGVIRIPTRQLENAEVTVFYRQPPPSAEPPRVLVILPPFNDGVAELCADTHPWARFADANNLVLVVPQFFQVYTVWKADHPCSPYHYPQLWAGQVLLDALEGISSQHEVSDEKILMHGLGAGAQFVARFARWRPDRVAAISLHSGAGDYAWKEGEQGLKPLSTLAGLPVLLTTGETNAAGLGALRRRASTDTFYTALKGMGAKVEFHEIDTTFHKETLRLRELSESFLTRQLNSQ